MPHSGVQLCKKRWILSTNNTEINQKFGSLERNKKMEDVWASQTEKTKKSKLSKPTYKATETKRCFGWRRGPLLVQSPLNVGWTTHHSAGAGVPERIVIFWFFWAPSPASTLLADQVKLHMRNCRHVQHNPLSWAMDNCQVLLRYLLSENQYKNRWGLSNLPTKWQGELWTRTGLGKPMLVPCTQPLSSNSGVCQD